MVFGGGEKRLCDCHGHDVFSSCEDFCNFVRPKGVNFRKYVCKTGLIC